MVSQDISVVFIDLLEFWYKILALLEILTNSFGLSCRLRDVSVVRTVFEQLTYNLKEL